MSMNKGIVLVIMAAGLGSRFKGLKQIQSVDADGHVLMDYAIYDAIEAGFSEVVFIIRKDFQQLRKIFESLFAFYGKFIYQCCQKLF